MSMPAEHLNSQITLAELLAGFAEAPELAITGIASDSRKVEPGDLFLACEGFTRHGLDFANDVVRQGAVAISFDSSTARTVPQDLDIVLVPIAGLAAKLGEIANRYFASPSSDVGVVGVTGTNGKSTVAWLVTQCLAHLSRKCGYSGTLGYGLNELDSDDDMTSPDVVEIHRRLAMFRDLGAVHAAMEVSSHALDQARIAGVQFDATLFTNLSRDHIDYHGDMRAYGDAKAKLFTDYPARVRIVNLDSEFGTELAARCSGDVITVSTRFDRVANGRPHVFVRSVVARQQGSEIGLQTSWGEARVFVPLVGDFNVANSVLVLAYLLSYDIELADACAALEAVNAPPGRMQRVDAPAGPTVFIDYAHTPNALEVALRALRLHTQGRLHVVFGCGGDRDTGKRPLMARIAERLADRVVITSDNPRFESPARIIDDIVDGLARPHAATVIEDRAAAIAWAIANAAGEDEVLIAGKGHENYQIIGDERIAFSDYGAAFGNLATEATE